MRKKKVLVPKNYCQPNLKHKNNKILTAKTHQEAAKTHQEAAKHIKKQQKHIKKQQKHIKKQKDTSRSSKNTSRSKKTHEKIKKTQQVEKTQQKSLKLQNLTYEKPSKLGKHENLTSQKQQIMFNNKKNRNCKRKT